MPDNPIQVKIQSFQSIDELKFEIDGFTCITGATNIGKSAIIRAVSGSILNRPVGTHVRRGQKFCTVEMESGRWGFKWEKGARAGRYWVAGSDKPLDGIGMGQTHVTEDIGFRSVKVGDKTIHPWYAAQLFPLFLLDQTGPAVTDFISDISRLKVLQDAIVLNVRRKKRLLDRASLREEELVDLEKKRGSLDDLEKLETLGPQLQDQLASIREYEDALEDAKRIRDGLEASASSIRVLRGVKDVRVAKLPDREAESLRPAGRIWFGLRRAAASIIPLRGAKELAVPDLPELDSDSLRAAARLSAIPVLAATVERLEAWSLIPPPSDMPDLSVVSRAASMRASLAAARSSVEFLEGRPEVPEAPDGSDLDQLRSLPSLREIADLKAEIESLGRERQAIEDELSGVEDEIASIPTCPACGRPTADPHAHVTQQPAGAG